MDRKKILLVDDSSTVLLMERMILSKSDYEVVTAKDGQEGVEKALAERPDLILMDVVMPRMDGFEACRRIKQQPWPIGRCPAVVMVTGRTGAVDRIRGTLAGCEAYLTKPLAEEELVKVLAQHDHVFDRVFEPTVPGFGGESRQAWSAGE